MTSKTIKISEENYRWLLGLASELQKERGKLVSFDEAIEELKEDKKGDIMELAGRWKMSDKEAKEFMKGIRKGWKRWKVQSV